MILDCQGDYVLFNTESSYFHITEFYMHDLNTFLHKYIYFCLRVQLLRQGKYIYKTSYFTKKFHFS